MKQHFQKLTVVTALCLGTLVSMIGNVQAALLDRGGGLIFDNVLNVTWLQDVNYARTSGADSDGQMTWSEASVWAGNLIYHDSVRNVDWNDWRLPRTLPVSGASFNYNLSFNGSTDYSFNISAPGSTSPGSTSSELAYIFFQNLGNKAYNSPAGVNQPDYGFKNTGPFVNLALNSTTNFWSGTDYAYYANTAFLFRYDGLQSGFWKNNRASAWVVRDGDVAAAPIPAAAWLFWSGVLGLSGVARRKQLHCNR